MENKDLKSYIAYIKKNVDVVLKDIYDVKISEAGKLGGDYKKLVTQTAKQTLSGGKRLRPALAVLGYTIAGGKDLEKIIKASAALEIFHSYLLIHDDIMDRDDRRHGVLNVTGFYKKALSGKVAEKEIPHVADSFAILAGDINSGLTFESLLSAKFDSEVTLKAISRVSQAVFEVAAGQHLDIIGSFDKKLSEKEILAIAKHKTADYSIILPLQFGAILAGAKPELLDAMKEFGQPLGVSYQIADDVLGIFGSAKAIGKPVLTDLQEGKQTILMHYGMKLASVDDKKSLQAVFGNPKADQKDLVLVKKILERCGAKAKTLIIAKDYITKSISYIPSLTSDSKMQENLTDFANYCISRKN